MKINNLVVIDEREVLGKQFRIYGDFENPLWLAKDVAEWLEMDISNASRMLKNVDDDEKLIARHNMTRATFLTEDGLYKVLVNSRKQIACEIKQRIQEILKYSKIAPESRFGNLLVEALKELDIDIISQYKVGKYKIDFYIPKHNISVEYDEQQHFTETNKTKDIERQKYIEDKLGCKFIRCDYRDSDIKNLMKVVKEVMKWKEI